MIRSTKPAAVLALVLLSASAPAPAPAPAAPAGGGAEDLHRLFEDRYAWQMEESPETAMRRGDYSHPRLIDDRSLAAIARRHERTLEHAERLQAIDPAGLAEPDRISYELFKLDLERAVEDHRFRMFLAPMGQRSGPHQDIPQMAEGVHFETVGDYDNYFRRLQHVPDMIDDVIEVMQRGLLERRTPPQIALLGVPEQLDALVNGTALDALAGPLEPMPASFSASERRTLRGRYTHEVQPPLLEAVERLRDYFVGEYLPGCRTSIAATALPDGEAYYAHQLRTMTTTSMSARKIHELGLREVARIRAQMLDVIRGSDFLSIQPGAADLDDDDLFHAFVEYLHTDPRFYYETPDELLAGYREICKRIDAWLPRFFRTLPRLPYGVRKIPDFMAPHQTTAYYSFGSLENGEPGWFYANTSALDQRPRYEMIALAMHEAVPGHHLQSALAQELEDVPAFRRHTWFTAFGEGWALYAERLGIEMGLYDDPYDDFGRLLYEMWRACRLVVDPGMHALGWSRERAIRYMGANTALSDINIVTEIDRYIAWPGQACAYKIGELKIRELRRQAEDRLGESFDLRAFHDVVLGAGSVPLSVLQRRVREWIRGQPAGAMYD